MIDSGSGSSHITRNAVEHINGTIRPRERPLQVIGFGNQKSSIISTYTNLTLTGSHGEKIKINFNIFENQLISNLPGVNNDILDEFPHLLAHKQNLSAPIPRNEQVIDAIIGVRDLPKLYHKHMPKYGIWQCPEVCVMYRSDGDDSILEARRSIFGTIITGIFNTYESKGNTNDRIIVQCKPCGKNHKETKSNLKTKTIMSNEENTLITKEIPLDILLKHAIGCSYDDASMQKGDRSALQTTAHKEFKENVSLVKSNNGARYEIRLTRLPENLYPLKVDGINISGSAIHRFISLEKRLDHRRNKKLHDGVHDCIKSLINDEMMIKVGLWDEHKRLFMKNQEPGEENLVLPWKTVIDVNKTSEHSKIRMCLVGTESNKLIHKINTAMPELRDILMRWKSSSQWCTIDIVKMFWSIQTHKDDAKLQHCVWRDHKDEKLIL